MAFSHDRCFWGNLEAFAKEPGLPPQSDAGLAKTILVEGAGTEKPQKGDDVTGARPTSHPHDMTYNFKKYRGQLSQDVISRTRLMRGY